MEFMTEDEEERVEEQTSAEDDEQYQEYKRAKRVEQAKAEALKIEYDLTLPDMDKGKLKENCRLASTVKIGALVVYPTFVKNAVSYLGRDPQVSLIAAISYPHGEDTTDIKVKAVKCVVKEGVDEVEVYAPLSRIRDGSWMYFKRECRKLKKAARMRAVRLVIDCSAVEEKELLKACVAAADCKIDCLRLVNAEGYMLSRIKDMLKGRCLIKCDKAKSRSQFMNMCAMGADYVPCDEPYALADDLLVYARK